jgi:hypothetical protein
MAAKVTDIRNQRDARAKKLLLILVPVLIALGAWQGPKTLKQLRGEAAQPEASKAQLADVSGGETPAAPNDGSTPTPPVTASGDENAPSTEVPIANEQALPDTDQPPAAGEGQLITFSRFEARDPFAQLVDDVDTSQSGESAGTPASGGSTPSSTGTPAGEPTTVPSYSGGTSSPPTSVAGEVKISVNGTVNVLVVGDTFPQNDPAFSVVAINGDSVEIGLVSGSFSTGQQTVTLKIGEPVTLISQPDGARFTLKLISAS